MSSKYKFNDRGIFVTAAEAPSCPMEPSGRVLDLFEKNGQRMKSNFLSMGIGINSGNKKTSQFTCP